MSWKNVINILILNINNDIKVIGYFCSTFIKRKNCSLGGFYEYRKFKKRRFRVVII